MENTPGMINISQMLDKIPDDIIGRGDSHGTNIVGGVGMAVAGHTDDDFFHLICHIDPQLKAKIEKGDYVDLDKLLSRDRMSPWVSDISGNDVE